MPAAAAGGDSQDNMTDLRRSYIDPATGQFLFLKHDRDHNGWVPSVATMEAWRDGRIRVYSPSDSTDRFITMPGHYSWPILTPAEETNIRVMMARPWIPDGQSIEGLRDDQIDDFDALQHLITDSATSSSRIIHHHHHHMLDTLLRPSLIMDMPLTLMSLQQRPPSASFDGLLAAAILASAAPDLSPSPTATPPRPPTFPKHLADQVLAAAEAAGQTCPITMEPIKRSAATITSCGHVFQKEAIAEWMQGHDTCPECRQPCSV